MRTLAAIAVAASLIGAPAVLAEDGDALKAVVEARSDEDKARDGARNPYETLSFFGLQEDMTVVEALPGGGWYTRIILPYVAEKGRYAAANYPLDMFAKVIPNMTDERMAQFRAWPEAFPERAAGYVEGDPEIAAFAFGDAPEDLAGEVDMVLYVRALHNFFRLKDEPYGAAALQETYGMLKPGGYVGVVQHRAQEDMADDFASGRRGYVKKSAVVAKFEDAGFVLIGDSEVNANPKDRPSEGDFVWRLPPTLALGDKNRDAYEAIGESDRMTLLFQKPVQ
ncbi:MAG: methyltransferase [Pseudomonadota bacterium]